MVQTPRFGSNQCSRSHGLILRYYWLCRAWHFFFWCWWGTMSTPHPNPKRWICVQQCVQSSVFMAVCRAVGMPGAEAMEFCHPYSGQSEWTLGLPVSLSPRCRLSSPHQPISVLRLPLEAGKPYGSPCGQNRGPLTADTHQTRLLQPRVQPDTHPAVWPWT